MCQSFFFNKVAGSAFYRTRLGDCFLISHGFASSILSKIMSVPIAVEDIKNYAVTNIKQNRFFGTVQLEKQIQIFSKTKLQDSFKKFITRYSLAQNLNFRKFMQCMFIIYTMYIMYNLS